MDNCNLTTHQLVKLDSLRASIAAVSALACALSIGLFVYRRLYHRFIERLVVYLLILSLLYSFSGVFQWVAIFYNSMNGDALRGCKAVGFLTQYSSCAVLLFLFALSLLLFASIVLQQDWSGYKWEVTTFLISLFTPALFSWIPFVHDHYGLSGAWCWISAHNATCGLSNAGLYEQVALWYVPQTLLMLIATSLIVVIVLNLTEVCCFKVKDIKVPREVYQKALKKLLPLLAYPIVFFVVNTVSLICRVTVTANVEQLWLLYLRAIIDPSWGLLACIAFLVHLHYLSKASARSGSAMHLVDDDNGLAN